MSEKDVDTRSDLERINELKTHYSLFYTHMFNTLYKLKELPVYRPKPPLDDEFALPNAAKVFNIKHRDGEQPPIDIDKTHRQIIIDHYAYSKFNTLQNDGYLYFIERDSYRNVELAMRYKDGDIEVKDWNSDGWLPLNTYIGIILEPHFKILDRKSYQEKSAETRMRYDRLKQILSRKLDGTFNIQDYYPV